MLQSRVQFRVQQAHISAWGRMRARAGWVRGCREPHPEIRGRSPSAKARLLVTLPRTQPRSTCRMLPETSGVPEAGVVSPMVFPRLANTA